MLSLTLIHGKPGEDTLYIADIPVRVTRVDGPKVSLGIEAPPHVPVDREKIYLQKAAERGKRDATQLLWSILEGPLGLRGRGDTVTGLTLTLRAGQAPYLVLEEYPTDPKVGCGVNVQDFELQAVPKGGDGGGS